jgi:hypothetical protein
MDLLSGFFGLGLVGVAMVLTFFLCIFIWSTFLLYRKRAIEVRGSHAKQVASLEERVEKLEKKCVAMQEQITDAHMLLADERRLLDKKLSESFPEIIPPIAESTEQAKRSAKRERTRD